MIFVYPFLYKKRSRVDRTLASKLTEDKQKGEKKSESKQLFSDQIMTTLSWLAALHVFI